MIIHLYSIQHILIRYVLLMHRFCQRFQFINIIENQQFALIWSYHRIWHSYYHLLQCCLTFCECFHTFHHHRKPVLMNVFSEITLPTFFTGFLHQNLPVVLLNIYVFCTVSAERCISTSNNL